MKVQQVEKKKKDKERSMRWRESERKQEINDGEGGNNGKPLNTFAFI